MAQLSNRETTCFEPRAVVLPGSIPGHGHYECSLYGTLGIIYLCLEGNNNNA